MKGPFYRYNQLQALNYGSLGMVIGHEIAHGFDTSGIYFDKDGNFKQWMGTSKREFTKKTKCFINIYNNARVYGKKLNGTKTLDESIADNVGIKYSYRAYKELLATNGQESKLPGLDYTNEQLFFISFAQTWCTKYLNIEVIDYSIANDVHSLNPARAEITLSNFPEFYEAFNCKKPEKYCTLW